MEWQSVFGGYLRLFSPDFDLRREKMMKVKKMKRAINKIAVVCLLFLCILVTSRFSQIILDGSGASSIMTYSPSSWKSTFSSFLSPLTVLVYNSLAALSWAS